MRISKETLKGYILEEVLAYLIRTTGYKLLVDRSQDPIDLDNRGNGLVVKGRGGVHQVDVLGQLEWIPAFTFPLRLFVEAKFRKSKTGIEIVRNAIGVLLDINQNNFPNREQKEFPPKYQYVYALFSTSGFTKPAMDMALAHQISLIDLSGVEYQDLRDTIDQSAERIAQQLEGIQDDDYEIDSFYDSRGGRLIKGLRFFIRNNLQTLPSSVEYQEHDINRFSEILTPVLEKARQYNELFVAMANGPFMLLMKADNPQVFLDYATNHPRHRVLITWDTQDDEGRSWKVTPSQNNNAYKLSFRIPEILAKWIFNIPNATHQRAIHAKQEYFSTITIYRYIDGKDFLFRLEFDLENTLRHAQEANR